MIKFGSFFSAYHSVFCVFLLCSKIVSSRLCPGVASKVCNCFLPAKDKYPYTLCNNHRGKSYNAGDCCSNCYDWTGKLWEKATAYCEKLAIERQKKRGEKGLVFLFCFCFFITYCYSNPRI